MRNTMNLKGVVINVNYPDDECEAAVPSEMTVDQLHEFLKRLISSEPDMTSFIITAVVTKS